VSARELAADWLTFRKALRWMRMPASSPVNLANPEAEPTDEQLQALSREAFAGVAEQHHDALARLRKRIALLRAEALARLARFDPARADEAT
jgi:hypothetical protein